MTQQIFDDYLKALYLKSKTNLRNGFDEKIIARLIGLDRNEAQNVIHYLAGKNYLDTKNNFGDNISLTPNGIDYVLELHKNKVYKVIRFQKAKYLPPASRLVFGFFYWYDTISDDGKIEQKTISAFASDILTMTWGLTWEGNGNRDAEKILLQFAKNKIIEKLKEGTLNEHEELTLMTSNQPNTCPYNSENLIETKFAEFEIEMESKTLYEEIMENKLAPSIIETRDEINAIFREKYKSNLLLLNEERNLLDFFKTASSLEEFSFRVSSLGEVSRNLNIHILRKLTNNELDTEKKSVDLLEEFIKLQNIDAHDIIAILRNFGKIRQAYPIHSDNSRVIKGLEYFKLDYPVKDFENSWTTLLDNYLISLKQLFNLLTELPTTKK
jgi:hypothetical protein